MSFLAISSLVVALAAAEPSPAALQEVAATYRGNVERVFGEQCADCHGQPPATLAEPALATAKKKSARAHRKFNMDKGFPFASKWPLPKLLAEIVDEVEGGDMPPRKYLKAKGVTLPDADRRAIVDWARAAGATLKPAQ